MNEAETELLAAVAGVVRAFEKLGVDYLVGGSVARFPTGNGATCSGCSRCRRVPPSSLHSERPIDRNPFLPRLES